MRPQLIRAPPHLPFQRTPIHHRRAERRPWHLNAFTGEEGDGDAVRVRDEFVGTAFERVGAREIARNGDVGREEGDGECVQAGVGEGDAGGAGVHGFVAGDFDDAEGKGGEFAEIAECAGEGFLFEEPDGFS